MTMSNITGGGGRGTTRNVACRRCKEESSHYGLISAAELGLRALVVEDQKEEEVNRARSILFSSFGKKFDSGYWVLVVAHDPMLLQDLEQKFRDNNCEVTTCSCPIHASSMLLEDKYKFDFVYSAFTIHNGYYELFEIASDLTGRALITVSTEDSEIVVKVVTQGECDYLIQPIDMQAIKNICQNVAQKRSELKELEHSSSNDSCDQHLNSPDNTDISTPNKPMVVWSHELEVQFNGAMLSLGVAEARPEQILERMKAPGLTVEDVTSHLKEYRLELDKIKMAFDVAMKCQAKRRALVQRPKRRKMCPRNWCEYEGNFLGSNFELSLDILTRHQGCSQKNEQQNSSDDMKMKMGNMVLI